jgi:hypothetical protein
MKRFVLLAVLTSAAALAASRAETTTYVDGNLAGVSPNTGGTLLFNDEKSMSFRTGLTSVAVPYSGISNVELGAVKETSHNVPVYKVWALHKRLTGGNKTQTQLLIVNFKNDEGEDRTMTLELAESAMNGVVSTIESHTGKTYIAKKKDTPAAEAKNSNDWWGDDYWRTKRNADKWNKAPGNNNDQQ